MATTFSPYERGEQVGTHYLFDNVGDGITMHTHQDRSTWHNTVCLKGRVAIYGDEIDIVLEPGQTANYKCYRMHELAALEAGTEIANMFLIKPPGYDETPKADLCGCIQATLFGKDHLK